MYVCVSVIICTNFTRPGVKYQMTFMMVYDIYTYIVMIPRAQLQTRLASSLMCVCVCVRLRCLMCSVQYRECALGLTFKNAWVMLYEYNNIAIYTWSLHYCTVFIMWQTRLNENEYVLLQTVFWDRVTQNCKR